MDSSITYDKSGNATALSGPDANNMFRAALLAASLKMYAESDGKIIPTRGVTGPSMLKLATSYTGKAYKRGQHVQAAADLDVWVQTMKAALPQEVR